MGENNIITKYIICDLQVGTSNNSYQFYLIFFRVVICGGRSIICADRFVFVFCLYFSHLVHRFFRQNGPSIWHKRFLRLSCTSKGKKGRFCGVFFFPSLYIFFLSSFTGRPIPDASIIRLALIHPRQQPAYTATTYIFYPTL